VVGGQGPDGAQPVCAGTDGRGHEAVANTDDRADYLCNLVRRRCPELTDADLAVLAAGPDSDTLPIKFAVMVLDVIAAAR
jgi:hypothetical protein